MPSAFVVGTDGTYNGFSDGTIMGALAGGDLYPTTVQGNTVYFIRQEADGDPETLEVAFPAGALGPLTDVPLIFNSVEYTQTSIVDMDTHALATYATPGVVLVNASEHTVDLPAPPEYNGPVLSWGPSTTVSGTGPLTIDFSAKFAEGWGDSERIFIALTTNNEEVTPPSGFTLLVPDSGDPFRGASSTGIRTILFWKDAEGTETTIDLVDDGIAKTAIGFVVNVLTAPPSMLSLGANVAATTSGAFDCQDADESSFYIHAISFLRFATDPTLADSLYNPDLDVAYAFADVTYELAEGQGLALALGNRLAAGTVGDSFGTLASAVDHSYITLRLRAGTPIISAPVETAIELEEAQALAPAFAGAQSQLLAENSSGTSVGFSESEAFGSLTPQTLDGVYVLSVLSDPSNSNFEVIFLGSHPELSGKSLYVNGVEQVFSGLSTPGNTIVGYARTLPVFIDDSSYMLALNPFVSPAIEADEALALGAATVLPLVRADEFNSALPLAAVGLLQVSPATEVDQAVGISPDIPVVMATEVDGALALSASSVVLRANELDSALPLAALVIAPLALATEVEEAEALVYAAAASIVAAQELNAAFNLAAALGVSPAVEADLAFDLGQLIAKPLARADEVDSALSLTATHLKAPVIATEADLALSCTLLLSFPVGAAVELSAARRLWPSVYDGVPDSTSFPQTRGSISDPQSRSSF